MFATKTIQVFNTKAIRPGYFVTYCEVKACWDTIGDSDEEVRVYRDSVPINGLITAISETDMEIMKASGTITRIEIEEVTSPKESDICFKILGIRENLL